ncbi:MAG: Asparagine--tRNA ligase [Candidatus Anoxychlamydiales bacterium]|nr:Asparagine--tRNA ligase [Candidatus Anoxychlamydiales bacterium]NGX36457.1 Asparagine--tRNA ligase [Candidatus Anoxychlamydiales bacterium]
MRLKIKKILKADDKIIGKKVKICGWVKTIRDQKSFAFIEISDGSTLSNLQAIIDSTNDEYRKILEISIGASIAIDGEVVKSPGKNQKYEIKIDKIQIIGTSQEDYPLQKKRHSFEYLRTISHLRCRTNMGGAVTRVRNSLIYHSHKFFQDRDFLYIQTPIITASDTEGAGDLFRVTTLEDLRKDPKEDFFKKKTFLTVSGQLNAEAFACGMSDVYVFSPAFRAENSHTSRHLAEFWMLEPEFAFADLKDNVALASDYIKYMAKVALDENEEDIAFFDKFIEKGLIERLKHVIESPFEVITYTDAIKILEKSNKKFQYPVKWGNDLQSEHERYLSEEHFKKPVVVIDYPKEIKAFYMKDNSDGKTVAAMDILVPKIGEIVGGAQREDSYDLLKKKIEMKKLDLDTYKWYLDLRKYGTVPHAGFGVGFERLVQFITGIENIRDVIPFYRATGIADF